MMNVLMFPNSLSRVLAGLNWIFERSGCEPITPAWWLRQKRQELGDAKRRVDRLEEEIKDLEEELAEKASEKKKK